MPASKSMLRLLSLAACAEVIVSFGTIARGDVEIGTESATGSVQFCPCSSYWYCRAAGPQSLTDPISGTFTADALAGFVNTCWNMCYKAKADENGVDKDAPFLAQCEAGKGDWLTAICTDDPYDEGDLSDPSDDKTYKGQLEKATTKDNPMNNGQIDCAVQAGPGKDERCGGILSPGSLLFETGSCTKGMKAQKDWNLDPSGTCDKLYKYSCEAGTRYAMYCKYEGGKCKASEYVAAFECKKMLCDPVTGRNPDDPACVVPAPQCK